MGKALHAALTRLGERRSRGGGGLCRVEGTGT